MDWNGVLGVINKLAPTIAAGLGGPLAGGAVMALQKVFGLTEGGTQAESQDALVAAISGATPDQLLAIKKADQEYALRMQELGFKNIEALEALATADRDSARKRETEIKDNTPRILAYAITIGYFAILAALMLGGVPPESKDILYIMLGTLGTAWVGVINYYYGSTSGSLDKSKLLAKTTK